MARYMSFALKHKLLFMTIAIAISLSLVLGFFVVNQISLQQELEAEKSEVVAKQISSRLTFFAQSSELALDEIVRNWPENHPNLEQWFTKLSLSILTILPELERIWFVDHQFQLQWHVPALATQTVNTIDLDFSELLEANASLSQPFLLSDGTQAIAIVMPVKQHTGIYGWVLGVVNIEASLSKLVSENLSSAYAFTLFDENTTLFEHGSIGKSKVNYDSHVNFVDRQLGIKLALKNQDELHSNYFIIAACLVIFFTLLCRLTLSNWLKASYSQKQFKAASDASLDGLLIFTKVGERYKLNEVNTVAKNMLHLTIDDKLDFIGLIKLLGADEHQLAENALSRLREGLSFERSIKVNTNNPELTYIKLQIVDTHNGIAVTVRDVSVRKQAERDLKDREAKYRRLVDGLHGHFLYSTDGHGEPDFVSAAITPILGYEPKEFIDTFEQLFPLSNLNSQRQEILKQMRLGNTPEPYLMECTNASGEVRLLEFTESPVMEGGTLVKIEGIAKDVTKEKALAEKVSYQAEHDFLTGLYNRYAFDDKLQYATSQVEIHDSHVTLSYIDLDQFKVVNDTCGHTAGDELLKQLGQLIIAAIDNKHIVARLGGDEFGIIFIDCCVDEAKHHLKALLQQLRDFRFVWEEQVFQISASVGVTVVNSAQSTQELMKQADVACYAAKDAGRNRINVYSAQDSELNYLEAGIGWVSRIQQALDENRFELYVQPIEAIGKTVSTGLHYEVLLRMLDEQGQLISPAQFIPAAERFNLMTDIDKWVVHNVLLQLKRAPKLLKQTQKCAINLSGTSIIDDSFADDIIEILKSLEIPAKKICFEITETAAVTKLSQANAFIDKLREFGCHFALDDFGVGMCSFAYLKNLPVDIIKIDGSFVKNVCQNSENKAIVSAINDIASALGKLTIAEFVGDQATKHLLADIGINYAQGFAIAKPLPLMELERNISTPEHYKPHVA